MELFESLGDWLYWHGPSDQVISQFFVTLVATSIVVITVTILEPYLRIWNRKRKRKAKKDLRDQRNTIRRLHKIVWRPSNEKERLERNQFIAELKPKLIRRTILVAVIIIMGAILLQFTGQYSAESTMALKESIRLNVESFDHAARLLRQKTVASTFNTTECDANYGARRKNASGTRVSGCNDCEEGRFRYRVNSTVLSTLHARKRMAGRKLRL